MINIKRETWPLMVQVGTVEMSYRGLEDLVPSKTHENVRYTATEELGSSATTFDIVHSAESLKVKIHDERLRYLSSDERTVCTIRPDCQPHIEIDPDGPDAWGYHRHAQLVVTHSMTSVEPIGRVPQ